MSGEGRNPKGADRPPVQVTVVWKHPQKTLKKVEKTLDKLPEI